MLSMHILSRDFLLLFLYACIKYLLHYFMTSLSLDFNTYYFKLFSTLSRYILGNNWVKGGGGGGESSPSLRCGVVAILSVFRIDDGGGGGDCVPQK